ncbi:MAG: helix-turn-helix transcriptional regulator [Clostridiales bacterium]|nr:helix-turn-helix transcriptional regulator [Clostridiales bacterium]
MLFLGYTLGQRIRYFRKRAGLTQKELAEMLDLSESALRNYELDNRTPGRTTLTMIADALKISYYALDMYGMSEINRTLHFLFEMEEMYQLKPDVIDDQLVLRFDTGRLRELIGDDPFADEEPELTEEEKQELDELFEKIPAPGAALDLENQVGNWYEAYMDYQKGLMDQKTYEDWKFKYPAFSGFDKKGNAVIYDQNQSLASIKLPDEFWDNLTEEEIENLRTVYEEDNK